MRENVKAFLFKSLLRHVVLLLQYFAVEERFGRFGSGNMLIICLSKDSGGKRDKRRAAATPPVGALDHVPMIQH
jgi:hypothetical protein